jgi:hydroxylamine reductase (hybrid-cluster protein)
VTGSEKVNDYLHNGAIEDFGACFHYIEDPIEAADKIVEILMQKRESLGINKKSERKLLDMKDRRAL